MLWYKSWVDTRSRFFLGLASLLVFACGTALTFPRVAISSPSMPRLLCWATRRPQQAFRAQLELMRTFRATSWSQWFSRISPLADDFGGTARQRQPTRQMGSGALFSLALPVSRGRWIGARAEIGVSPSSSCSRSPRLAFAALAPVVGEQFAVDRRDCLRPVRVRRASLFFGLAMFLSTLFNDVWRPLLLTCVGAIAIGVFGPCIENHGLFQAMGGSSYFFAVGCHGRAAGQRGRRSGPRLRRRRECRAAGFLIERRANMTTIYGGGRYRRLASCLLAGNMPFNVLRAWNLESASPFHGRFCRPLCTCARIRSRSSAARRDRMLARPAPTEPARQRVVAPSVGRVNDGGPVRFGRSSLYWPSRPRSTAASSADRHRSTCRSRRLSRYWSWRRSWRA